MKAWPAVVVLGFFLAARARLTRKPQFVTLGLVVGFASRYLALSLVVFVANYWLSRHSDMKFHFSVILKRVDSTGEEEEFLSSFEVGLS